MMDAMDDLISRQKAIEAIRKPHGGCYTEDAKNFAEYQLWSVPSENAVAVVCCIDCKHSVPYWENTMKGYPLKCTEGARWGDVDYGWFCEHGEREEDDGSDCA